jgi:hypothetical protein
MSHAIGPDSTDSPRDKKKSLLITIKALFAQNPTEDCFKLFVKTAKIQTGTFSSSKTDTFKRLETKLSQANLSVLNEDAFKTIEEARVEFRHLTGVEISASVPSLSQQGIRNAMIQKAFNDLNTSNEGLKTAYQKFLEQFTDITTHKVLPSNLIELFFKQEFSKLLSFDELDTFLRSEPSEFKKNLKNAQNNCLYRQYYNALESYTKAKISSALQSPSSDNTPQNNSELLVKVLEDILSGKYEHLTEKYSEFLTAEQSHSVSEAMSQAINALTQSNFSANRNNKNNILNEIKQRFDVCKDPTLQFHLIQLFKDVAGAHRIKMNISFWGEGKTNSLIAFEKSLSSKNLLNILDIKPIENPSLGADEVTL